MQGHFSHPVLHNLSGLRHCDLDHFTRKGNNLHIVFLSKLTGNCTKDSGSYGIAFSINHHSSIAVEPHVAAVGTFHRTLCANDNALMHFFVIQLAIGQRLFDSDTDNIAYAGNRSGLPASGRTSAKHFDTQRRLNTRVVGYIQHCFLLNHLICLLPASRSTNACLLSLLNCLLYDSYKTPTFAFAIGPGPHNVNEIAQTGLVMFVMDSELGPAPNVFAVFRMLDLKIDSHFDAFITAVANYDTSYRF
jgi:hypothetical protein